MKALRQYLKRYGFIGTSLDKLAFQKLQYFARILFNEVQSKKPQLFSQPESTHRISSIFQALELEHQQSNLRFILKKVGIMFMLIKIYIEKQKLDEKKLIFFRNQIQNILQYNVKILVQYKQKKASSLEKISNFIRELSGEKHKKHKSISKLESFTQKGTLKEIVNRIIQPFCNYLLKIMQNKQEYLGAIHPEYTNKGQSLWKIINWCHQLTDITCQLYRLGKYFKDQFRQILVFVTYICCKDISMCYDFIKISVQRQANEGVSNSCQRNGERLIEIKRFIQQMMSLKEKINFIFGNKELQNYIMYFQKPKKYKYNDESQSKQVQFILSYNQNRPKRQNINIHSIIQQSMNYIFLASTNDPNTQIEKSYCIYKNQEDMIIENIDGIKEDKISQQVFKRAITGTKKFRHFQKTNGDVQKQNKISNLRKEKKIIKIQ